MSVWALHQNNEIYQDAEKFNPDRYLDHPKLANEYATSPDYENRGESTSILTVLSFTASH